jgi:AsmA family protein
MALHYASPVRWRWIAVGIGIALLAALILCEAVGWPFLAGPLERRLSTVLDRRVALREDPAAVPQARVHLVGRVVLQAPYVEIAAPPWSSAPRMVQARDARLTLGYLDIWRAWRGAPLHVRSLVARELNGHIERLADGRASWQFGKQKDVPDADSEPKHIPTFGRLEVGNGSLVLRDAMIAADVDARFSLAEGAAGMRRLPPAADAASPAPSTAASDAAPAAAATAAVAASAVVARAAAEAEAQAASQADRRLAAGPISASTAAATPAATAASGLQLTARGTYRKMPLTIEVRTSGVLPLVGDDAAQLSVPVVMDANIGRATMSFRGTATDAMHFGGLKGRFTVHGPSLAAVGDPLGITLPTTSPFNAEGLLAKEGPVWNAVLERVGIGSSRLSGAFTYDPQPSIPLLSGRLNGSRLMLAELGPAVGAPARDTARVGARKTGAKAPREAEKAVAARVLPDRAFDLPSLRAMNANVLVSIDNFDLGSELLDPLRPLHAHLVLTDGVLRLQGIDARTGQGRLGGMVQLDGRSKTSASWSTDLRLSGVRLERWIHQSRSGNAPPYITGNLSGQARLAGEGRSTADILGSLRGGMRLQVTQGTISHLVVEGAGLDIAQGLGMLLKGDDSLKVRCTIADLTADRGVLRPRAFVLDTDDSTMWIDGSVSMATEALDLRVVVNPKDFSPLTLRAPVHVKGTLGKPSVSLETGRLAAKVGASALLALINPIAALIPLIDTGDKADAQHDAGECQALSRRIGNRPDLPAPASAAAQPTAAKRDTVRR